MGIMLILSYLLYAHIQLFSVSSWAALQQLKGRNRQRVASCRFLILKTMLYWQLWSPGIKFVWLNLSVNL